MKKVIFVLLILTSNILYCQYFWSGSKLLTRNFIDKNPSFGMKNTVSNPYLSYEFLAFERYNTSGYSNICVIKMGYNGNYDSVFYVTSGNNLCRNPSIDYYKSSSSIPTISFIVWEQYTGGRWNLFGRYHNSSSGWENIFPVDTTSFNKYNPSVARQFSDFVFGVAYERNSDIIYREFNVSTGAITYDTNLTSYDNSACRKPTLSANNQVGIYDKYVAYERNKSGDQYAIYKRKATYQNIWSIADSVTTVGNNRNPKFTSGSYNAASLTFESNRNGKWNVYNATISGSGTVQIESIYPTTFYNCRSFSSFFYPVITDLYSMLSSFVREGSDSVKILSGVSYTSLIIQDSITVGDTSKKPTLSVSRGIGSGRGYSTVWMVYNKDSAGYSLLYAKYRIILLDNLKKITGDIPEKYSLIQNYPNPFNSTTVIRYSLPRNDLVKIKIFNTEGKEIHNVLDKYQSAGNYELQMDFSFLPSGTYFYKIRTNNFSEIKRMVLIK